MAKSFWRRQYTYNVDEFRNTFRRDKKKWLVVGVVMLMNLSIAMVWLSFTAVAYKTSVYYDISLTAVNALSLCFIILAIPFGIIVTLFLEKFGLRYCLLTGSFLSAIGSSLRVFSAMGGEGNIAFLYVGQVIVACASPFGTYVSAKVAGVWFPEDERTFANTLVSIANPIGIIFSGIISPLFVKDDTINMLWLLITYDVLPLAVLLLMYGVMTTDGPEIAPSLAAERTTSEDIWKGIKTVVLHNPMYLILVLCIGGGIGIFSAFATLLEQILCPWGYTDTMSGASASMLTLTGVIGAAIIGSIVDKTGKLSETMKLAYFMTALGAVVFALTHSIYMGYAILAEVVVIGLFAFCIFPIGTEVATECTYPVGIATSTGIILFSGQIQSIMLILAMDGMRRPFTDAQVAEYQSKCYYEDFSADSTSGDGAQEITYDMRTSMYLAGGFSMALAFILILFFKPKYRRRMAEESANNETDICTTDL